MGKSKNYLHIDNYKYVGFFMNFNSFQHQKGTFEVI